jgi:hypothetical protein
MIAIIHEAVRLLSVVVGGRSVAGSQGLIMAAVALGSLLLVLRFAGAATGMHDCGWARRALGALVGLGAMLISATAVSLYLAPLVHNPAARLAVLIAAPLVGALAVGIPVQLPILKGNYGQVLFAFAASLACAGLIIIGLNSAMSSFRTGESEFSRIQSRKNVMERELGK